MKIRRDKRDKVFSDLVRSKYFWTCTVCGRYFPEGSRQGLHCSHFYSRRHKGLRYHPLNAAAHCFGCHQRLGENPLEFAAWIDGHIGKENAENLRVMASRISKHSKPELEDIFRNLRASWQQMEAQRQDGVQGRIEFESPYA